MTKVDIDDGVKKKIESWLKIEENRIRHPNMKQFITQATYELYRKEYKKHHKEKK